VNTLDPELVRALELVDEYDRNRKIVDPQPRLYYDQTGRILGLWETDYPDGNYIVLDNTDKFFQTNSDLMQVVDGKLKVTDPTVPLRSRLTKSATGQPVVKGHAALALHIDEQYPETDYYDRKTNN
jgi:hypothetical protein